MNSFVLLSLLGGLLAVDDRAGWQSLLAQPIFIGLLVGFATGETSTALAVGLSLELVWLSLVPVRGSRRPDQVLGAITGAGCAGVLTKLSGEPSAALAAVGVLLGLVAGELGGLVTGRLFGVLSGALARVTFSPDAGVHATARKILWVHAGSILYIFAVETLVVLGCLALGSRAADWVTRWAGEPLSAAAAYWNALLPAFGLAAVILLFWRRDHRLAMALGVVSAALVRWLG
jgi:mannose/fructose/N-acetylgalactosamine-specific phosphotransferase system component IIC